MSQSFTYVNHLWNQDEVAKLSPLERLVYRSNKLGSDQRITNTGGGNTSAKYTEVDPLTGDLVDVLWVKGSGGDLRTAKAEHFSSLYMDKLVALQQLYKQAPTTGYKTEVEDRMVEMYKHCNFNLNPRASSIDTPLHAFIPFKHVDHMHPNAIIAIAAAKRGKEITREVFGDSVVWMDWQRPGFDLGVKMMQVIKENPQAKGIMMGQHGIINWADDDFELYELTLSLIEKAAHYIEKHHQGIATFGGSAITPIESEKRDQVLGKLLPWLRGKVSLQDQRMVATVQTDETILRFVNSVDAPRLASLGTSCPDHFLRTKIKPLFVDWNPHTEDIDQLKNKLEDQLEQYKTDYAAYYERCRHSDSPPIRNSIPTVTLIPGLGMITWGKNKSESRVTAEFYNCAVEVMRGAEAIDAYQGLPEQEAFDIEYWWLEEAKLRRMPSKKNLDGQVIAVVGAGSGIGKELTQRIVKEGAQVVCVDLNPEAADATAEEITKVYGQGIGVAGSGISNRGPAIGLSADITDRSTIQKMLKQATLAYGGLDAVVITAGIFVPPTPSGLISDQHFSLTFDINVKGSYLVASEVFDCIFQPQNLPTSMVLTTSANAIVSKKGSVAYDTSKAAANHLVRELAVSLSPLVRVNAIAPATVVKGSSMFPKDRVIASLAKYQIPYQECEAEDVLRDRLADFYAKRTLTQRAITPADQAEGIYLLLTDQLSKTTGQIIPIDGGLVEAFLR